jgi:hypothetical protein
MSHCIFLCEGETVSTGARSDKGGFCVTVLAGGPPGAFDIIQGRYEHLRDEPTCQAIVRAIR